MFGLRAHSKDVLKHVPAGLSAARRRLLYERLEDRRLLATFFSGTISSDTTWNDACYVIDGDVTIDPGVTLTIGPNVQQVDTQFTAGGTNIFDTFPDENIRSNSFIGIFVYPRRTAPFGFNGGYYYVSASFEF